MNPRNILREQLCRLQDVRFPTIQRIIDQFFDEMHQQGYAIIDTTDGNKIIDTKN